MKRGKPLPPCRKATDRPAPVRHTSRPARMAGAVTETRVTLAPRHVLAAGLTALGLGSAGTALAQPAAYVFHAPEAPTVLQTDAGGRVIVPAGRPDLAVPPLPVPHVMNGGGFGLSGFDYYNDQLSEGRVGSRKRPRSYVLAPAYIAPPLPPR
ncbi:hypothetical protein MET9862_03348 [Methylobacterium symbioticum]|uniref:Uncharacterized protein n=1 Tax=Methylobacterium symbioticum TaxID=2584084 RepID=A0A509EF27_9HYPH|nr:hypothetical protein MET9862_03348 [Methylobacterium symbioticum]